MDGAPHGRWLWSALCVLGLVALGVHTTALTPRHHLAAHGVARAVGVAPPLVAGTRPRPPSARGAPAPRPQSPLAAAAAPASSPALPPSPSPRPLHAGLLGTLVGAVAMGLITRQRRQQNDVLQPLLMASVTAAPAGQLLAPAEALSEWLTGGATLVDVRSEMETRDGRVWTPNKGALPLPLITAQPRYDPVANAKTVVQEANSQWLAQVQAKVPKTAHVIIMCSDGGRRTEQARRLLAAEGYGRVSGLEGGFLRWDQTFDRQLRPRPTPKSTTPPADPIPWLDWAEATGRSVPPPLPEPTPAAPTLAPVAFAEPGPVPSPTAPPSLEGLPGDVKEETQALLSLLTETEQTLRVMQRDLQEKREELYRLAETREKEEKERWEADMVNMREALVASERSLDALERNVHLKGQELDRIRHAWEVTQLQGETEERRLRWETEMEAVLSALQKSEGALTALQGLVEAKEQHVAQLLEERRTLERGWAAQRQQYEDALEAAVEAHRQQQVMYLAEVEALQSTLAAMQHAPDAAGPSGQPLPGSTNLRERWLAMWRSAR